MEILLILVRHRPAPPSGALTLGVRLATCLPSSRKTWAANLRHFPKGRIASANMSPNLRRICPASTSRYLPKQRVPASTWRGKLSVCTVRTLNLSYNLFYSQFDNARGVNREIIDGKHLLGDVVEREEAMKAQIGKAYQMLHNSEIRHLAAFIGDVQKVTRHYHF